MRARRGVGVKKKPMSQGKYAADFEEWWQHYPAGRRVGKKTAAAEWERARKRGELPPLEDHIRAVRRYAHQQRRLHPDPVERIKYTLHPERWIKRNRWEDELPPTPDELSTETVQEAISPEERAAREEEEEREKTEYRKRLEELKQKRLGQLREERR